MTPEQKKAFDDTHALMSKVHPLFRGVTSFVAMMTLADLIAQWLLSHPPEELMPRITNLVECTHARLDWLTQQQEEETRH